MATYDVQDPATGKSVTLEGDSPPTEQELNQVFETVHGNQAPAKYGAKDYVGDIARPLLEGGGAVAGGLIGSTAGPFGTAAGGTLGFGVGKAGADLLDRSLGRKALLPNLSSAAKETGSDIYQGAQNEAMGLAASKVIPPLLKSAGKLGSQVGEWATGIPERNFRTVAENPEAILPGTMSNASEGFRNAMANAGISNDLTPAMVDRMRSPGQYAFDTFNKLKTTGQITPQEALYGRQSIDAMYPIPNPKNASYIRTLDQIRGEFQDVISNATPELQSASKDYAIAKAGKSFQHIFPQTRAGTPSYFRSGAVLAGLAKGHPSALFGIPAVAGTAAATVGPAGMAAQKLFNNPIAATGITGTAYNSLFGSKPVPNVGVVNPANNPQNAPQGNNNSPVEDQAVNSVGNPNVDHGILQKAKDFLILTKQKAREYLDQSNGDKDLARQLATKDGYTW